LTKAKKRLENECPIGPGKRQFESSKIESFYRMFHLQLLSDLFAMDTMPMLSQQLGDLAKNAKVMMHCSSPKGIQGYRFLQMPIYFHHWKTISVRIFLADEIQR
jgi:hypothetical protein